MNPNLLRNSLTLKMLAAPVPRQSEISVLGLFSHGIGFLKIIILGSSVLKQQLTQFQPFQGIVPVLTVTGREFQESKYWY